MPCFSVIYIKRTKRTPAVTTVTFLFPDGQSVEYTSDNVILEELTKEEELLYVVRSGRKLFFTYSTVFMV